MLPGVFVYTHGLKYTHGSKNQHYSHTAIVLDYEDEDEGSKQYGCNSSRQACGVVGRPHGSKYSNIMHVRSTSRSVPFDTRYKDQKQCALGTKALTPAHRML
jgi:hypothetical protein